MAAFTLLVAVLLVGAAQASYQYVYLSPFGDDSVGCGYTTDSACKTLYTALQQLQNGGTVNVMPGFYYGTANFVAFNMDVNLVAYQADQGPAVFDAQMQSQAYVGPLLVNGSASVGNHGITVNFRGLTFQNWAAGQYGIISSVADVNTAFTPTVGIHQCVFKNTHWGVFASHGNIQVDSTVIIGDLSYNSYGIYAYEYNVPRHQVSLLVANVTISNCNYGIYGNHASLKAVINQANINGVSGGGIRLDYYASASVDNCHIDQSGDGIYLAQQPGNPSPVTTISNTIFSNLGWGVNSGSGLTVMGRNEVRVKTSTFFNNTANNGRGGGIYCENYASMTVQSSSFNGNHATDGAAAWCNTLCAFNAANNYVSNNVESQNTGPCNGLPSAAKNAASEDSVDSVDSEDTEQ